jgi:hypothetical protein
MYAEPVPATNTGVALKRADPKRGSTVLSVCPSYLGKNLLFGHGLCDVALTTCAQLQPLTEGLDLIPSDLTGLSHHPNGQQPGRLKREHHLSPIK